MHGISNRDTLSYPMHNNLSVHLTKITMRLTAFKLVSEVSAPVCTNGVWPLRQIVSEKQKIKPLTMFPSNVQSVDLPMDCMAWQCWTMRPLNACSTLAPRSSIFGRPYWSVSTLKIPNVSTGPDEIFVLFSNAYLANGETVVFALVAWAVLES